MSKKGLFLLATIALLLVVALTAPAALAQFETTDSQPATNQEDPVATPDQGEIAPDSVERITIPNAAPGFYVGNGRGRIPEPAEEFFAAGSFTFWAWSELNPGSGLYNWDALDEWIQTQVDAGYEGVGIALYHYTGRFVPCPIEGVDAMPQWIQNGPDGIADTSDDPLFVAGQPDGRDYDGCTNFGGPWHLPDYANSWLMDQYEVFITALAEHLLTTEVGSHVKWIATGVGKDGENRAADNRSTVAYDENWLRDNAGLSVADWNRYVTDIIDLYKRHFYSGSGQPYIQVVTQNAPFYLSLSSRRFIGQYAGLNGVGVSINGMTADFEGTEACNSVYEQYWCTGMYDPARQYGQLVPVMFESYAYMMGTENEFYWSMARALDFKGDYMRLSAFWDTQNTPNNRTVAEWASRYFGKGFMLGQEAPPSIWSRMREHRVPCYLTYVSGPVGCNWYPTNGNYEFYLTQLHLPAHKGVTLAVTDDNRTRVTGWDQAGHSDVTEDPWHYNTSPVAQPLIDAGLFDAPTTNAQRQVDPGYVARRSDQVSGNHRFIFDASDSYFARSQPGAESTFKVIITVTYLDHGDDQWLLIYDSTSGPKPAELYAINDWDVAHGLALAEGLPSTGQVPAGTSFVQKTDSGNWKVATFRIEDGNFNNMVLAEARADFYIESRGANGEWDGDEYIHHVDVRKVSELVEVTPTPTPTLTPTALTPTVTPTPTETSTPTVTPTATPSVGSVTGIVFADFNGNNQPDPGEGLAGAELSISILGGAEVDSQISAADGTYTFASLSPGNYWLQETPPDGYGPAKPTDSIAVVVQAGNAFPWNFMHDPVNTPTVTPTTLPGVKMYLPVLTHRN